MKNLLFVLTSIFFSLSNLSLHAQNRQTSVTSWNLAKLNTASNETYMTTAEKEMILEINKLRSDPAKYADYIKPYLKDAVEKLNKYGKGPRNYSIETSYITINNKQTTKVDTTWHYQNEEEVRAIESLMNKLNRIPPLSILLPSNGIYNAARKHAMDQIPTGDIDHVGTDGSWPWDRIKKAAPTMKEANENIACDTGTAREVVIQLLIDAGIPGYGHRETLLNSHWTHCACYCVGKIPKGLNCTYWIQNFGSIHTY